MLIERKVNRIIITLHLADIPSAKLVYDAIVDQTCEEDADLMDQLGVDVIIPPEDTV